MAKRSPSFSYFFFYVLFLPDTWQLLAGIGGAYLFTPLIIEPHMTRGVKAMLYIMCATIGYAGFRVPGRWISNGCKSLILGNKRPH